MTKSFNKHIASLLVRKMNEINISNAELADKIGVARSSVGDWISGKSVPKTDKVNSICDVLGITYFEFFDRLDPSNITIEDQVRLNKIHQYKSLADVVDNFFDKKD